MHLLSAKAVKETAWRWRCKLLNTKDEKTLSDYSVRIDDIISGVDKKADDAENAAVAKPAGGKAKGKDKDVLSEVGGSVIVKTLYADREVDADEGYYNWLDYPPRQLSKSAARLHDRVAIRLYKVKDMSKPVIDGRFAVKLHSMDVQNPLLVAALVPLLREHEDVLLDPTETATFTAPFRPLYFCYDAIVARLRGLQPAVSADDAALQPYLRLFVCVLDEVFAELRAKRRGLAGRGLINFEYAWTYFPRNSIVRSHGHNSVLLSKVVDTQYVKMPAVGKEILLLVIRAKVLRFNGEAFVWETQALRMQSFDGNRPVTEFDHCPLSFLPAADQGALKTRLAARGRLVLDCQGLAYRQYTGVGIQASEPGHVGRHNVDGRVLIDVVGYNKHHLAKGVRENKNPEAKKNIVPGTGRLDGRAALHAAAAIDGPGIRFDADGKAIIDTAKSGGGSSGKIRHLTEQEQEHNRQIMMEKPDELMFMSPMVEGYALKNKLWFAFYVEDLQPIVWNDQAYEHLVYDKQQKDLVLSFVESHDSTTSRMDDVIVGKGNGLIALLSGPPGTGKTLTAEAVADRTHRPLFYLQAEDLGIDAAALGANIKKVFEMATEWDAVILLDEADVFMAERHPQDIARNELVSIFLRELEYYRGIIFLTTNLYDTIDSAFRSRVSLHLLFRPLTAEARQSVWRKFLARVEGPAAAPKAIAAVPEKASDGPAAGISEKAAGKAVEKEAVEEPTAVAADAAALASRNGVLSVDISDEELVELAAWNLNGREIKTAVKMVTTWCLHKGHSMTLERLENGIRVTSPHATKTAEASTDLYDD